MVAITPRSAHIVSSAKYFIYILTGISVLTKPEATNINTIEIEVSAAPPIFVANRKSMIPTAIFGSPMAHFLSQEQNF